MSMNDLFDKVKLAAGAIPNNLDETAPGRMQMRDDAPRAVEGMGRPWGEGRLSNEDTTNYSGSVEREAAEGRERLLEHSFEDFSGMAGVDKSLMRELFSTFGDASTVSHSPLLQKKASHEPPPTLAQRVQRLR